MPRGGGSPGLSPLDAPSSLKEELSSWQYVLPVADVDCVKARPRRTAAVSATKRIAALSDDDESTTSSHGQPKRRRQSDDSESVSSAPMSRKESRKQRNRESAARSRERARTQQLQMEKQLAQLVSENAALRRENEELKRERSAADVPSIGDVVHHRVPASHGARPAVHATSTPATSATTALLEAGLQASLAEIFDDVPAPTSADLDAISSLFDGPPVETAPCSSAAHASSVGQTRVSSSDSVCVYPRKPTVLALIAYYCVSSLLWGENHTHIVAKIRSLTDSWRRHLASGCEPANVEPWLQQVLETVSHRRSRQRGLLLMGSEQRSGTKSRLPRVGSVGFAPAG